MKAKPHQTDLNALMLVQRLHLAGSFTAAAEQLGCSKTALSLQLKQLEQNLGVALFRRTTRQLCLTRAGEQLLQNCVPLLDALQDELQNLQSANQVLKGSLVISAPEDYANQVLVPAVVAFRQLHPLLQIEFRNSDQVKDLLKEGIDLSIRIGWLKDSSQTARKLGDFQQWLLACPAFLQTHFTPTAPDELPTLDFIAFTPLQQPTYWTFSRQQQQAIAQLNACYHTNSTQTITALMLAGAGFGILPDYSARTLISSGRLQQLLPQWQLPKGGIYAVYPPGRFRPARVTAFVDFLQHFQTQLLS